MKKTMLSVALMALLMGCNESKVDNTADNNNKTDVKSKDVKIYVEALSSHNGEFRAINDKNTTYTNLGSSDANATIKDFRFFLSDIKLINKNGKEVLLKVKESDYQHQDTNTNLVLFDYETSSNKTTNNLIDASVAQGDYTAIEFTLGVPEKLNHIEFPDINALNHSKMAWNWQAGRKFTKIELLPNGSKQWNFHLGSTGCKDNDGSIECKQPNRVRVKLDNFDITKDTIVFDLSKLIEDTDITTNDGAKPGCMGSLADQDCLDTFVKLDINIDAKDGKCTGSDCSEQVVFNTGSNRAKNISGK